jgi:hypothetical protein
MKSLWWILAQATARKTLPVGFGARVVHQDWLGFAQTKSLCHEPVPGRVGADLWMAMKCLQEGTIAHIRALDCQYFLQRLYHTAPRGVYGAIAP